MLWGIEPPPRLSEGGGVKQVWGVMSMGRVCWRWATWFDLPLLANASS